MTLRYRLLSITLTALLLSSTGYALGDMGDWGDHTWPGLSDGFKGQFIEFSFDIDSWSVQELSVGGEVIADKIWLPKAVPKDFAKESGSFNLLTFEYSFTITDFSSPVLVYRAYKNQILKIDLNRDVSTKTGDSGLLLEKNSVSADLIFSGDIETRGRIMEINMKNGDMLQIRFSISSPHSDTDAFDDALQDALSLKKLGAEGYVKDGNFSFVSYDNLSITPLSMSEKKMVFSVESSESSGKTVTLHISSGNFTEPSVLLDGVPVKKGSYYDALFSTGNEGIWNCTEADGELVILVYVPHFSTHALTIEEGRTTQDVGPVPPGVSSVSPIPIIIALLVSTFAGILLVWRKRNGTP